MPPGTKRGRWQNDEDLPWNRYGVCTVSLVGIAPRVRATQSATRNVPVSKGETLHRLTAWATGLALAALLASLIVKGAPYYTLSLEERPFSPLHSQLRPSGTVGIKLGIIALVMFGILFLYPLRK